MNQNEYFDAYNAIEIRAYMLAGKVRLHGLASLNADIDREQIMQKNPFDIGLQLICLEKDTETVAIIMDGFINLAKDPEQKTLNQITKEAILGIQSGINPGLLVKKLNSHVPFGKEDAQFIYDKEMEYLKNPEAQKKELAEAEEVFSKIQKQVKNKVTAEGGTLSIDEIDALLNAYKEKARDLQSQGKTLTIDDLRKIAEA